MLPASVKVETAEENAESRLRTKSATNLGFLQTLLLVFGLSRAS